MLYETWPKVEEDHLRAVTQVVLSGQWHYGNVYQELEKDMETLLGRPVVTTSSCAWAIYLALRTLGPFEKVAVPAYTYHGTVHPVLWNGAHPVFVDVNPGTFNICTESLYNTLKEGIVNAVVAVHIHGMPFDREVIDICREFDIPLIEDACQAQGAEIGGVPVGALGDASAFSFNTRKMVPAGLGGAVAFRLPFHAGRAKELRDYGRRNELGGIEECGSYLPISEFDAAIVRVQLKKLSAWMEHGERLSCILKPALKQRAPHTPKDRTHTWHKYRIRGTSQERSQLEARGVRTSFWVSEPLSRHPVYARYVGDRQFPGAEEVCKNTFCLFDDEHPLIAQSEELINTIARIVSEELE